MGAAADHMLDRNLTPCSNDKLAHAHAKNGGREKGNNNHNVMTDIRGSEICSIRIDSEALITGPEPDHELSRKTE